MNRDLFTGSGTLIRFILRRDRVRLPVWLAGTVAFAAAFVPVFSGLLTDNAGNLTFAAMMENPAMIAIVGPAYGLDNYHTGAMYANMMLLFSVMIAAAMNIFLVTRHTRQDEEQGRLEVIRSLPVGRLSNLAATMLAAVLANLLLALATGLGMYVLRGDGMDMNGCMLFGAALGAVGLLFAAATALFCQFTANNRTATALSLMLLLVLYMMRAVGDLGPESLSLLSPLGLILRTETFVTNKWGPIGITLAVSVALGAITFCLAYIRDLGRGLVPEKPGRRHASFLLSTPYGLAVKLLRSSLIVWSIVIFVLAGMYGSVFGDMESFIEGNEMLRLMFAGNAAFSLLDQLIVTLMSIMSMIGAIPIVMFVGRISGEESGGHTEHVLGKAVSRNGQMAAYLLPAFIMSILFQVLTALGFWSIGSMVLEVAPSLNTFFWAALAYLPAIWAMMGLSAALVAFFPKAMGISYLYIGYSFITVYIGSIAGFPDWSVKLTPFGLIPQYPVEEINAVPLLGITCVSAVLVVLGFMGYRRRDMRAQ